MTTACLAIPKRRILQRPDLFRLAPDPLWNGCAMFLGSHSPLGTRAYDSSTRGNHATLAGMPLPATSASGWSRIYELGRRGWSLDNVSAPNDDRLTHAGLNVGTVHSVSIWVYLPSIGGVVWGCSSSGYAPYVEAATIYYSDSSYNYVTFSYSIPASTWTHLGLVRNGTSVSFYANGKAVDSPKTLGANNAITLTQIGGYASGTGITGKVADPGLWLRALSAGEMGILASRDPMLGGRIVPVQQYHWVPALSGTPLSVADDSFENASPFDVDEEIGTAVASGGTAPYAWEIVSETLL